MTSVFLLLFISVSSAASLSLYGSGGSVSSSSWGEWGEWSPCSSTCGAGTRVRTGSLRHCWTNNGDCRTVRVRQSSRCNTCSNPIVTWGSWSSCGATCIRSRVGVETCSSKDDSADARCEGRKLTRKSYCCFNSVVWSEWGRCSKSCGDRGLRVRTGERRCTNNNWWLCGRKLHQLQRCNREKSCSIETTTTQSPTTSQPFTTAQVVTTEFPTTLEATTESPTTMELTTVSPTTVDVTTESVTTLAPTTEIRTTLEATTESPTTMELTTESPTTLEATTESPTTVEITTESPTTVEPTTAQVTTESPTTLEVATTELPTTLEVTTESPTTMRPTTLSPTTAQVVTTESPTTVVITTESPTTLEITTESPTTVEPTTAQVTTESPTTELPTTAQVTTESPTTVELTTESVTTVGATTAFPTTVHATTESPTTVQPTTLSPTTAQVVTTELPTTAQVTTESPTTLDVTTESATTVGPTTAQVVTTESPTTSEIIIERTTETPTTLEVTTESPSTTELPTTAQVVTTESPTTVEVTTESATTVGATTAFPTTAQITTESPTTVEPTTAQALTTEQSPTTVEPTNETMTTPKCVDGTSETDSCNRWCYCSDGEYSCYRIRKEVLSLTKDERIRFINAYKRLFTDPAVRPRFLALIDGHFELFFDGLHNDIYFLPWHRWFILQIENLLREIDCRITLPYWAWSLTANDPWNQPYWANDSTWFGGDGVRERPGGAPGCVQTGPFRQGQFQLSSTSFIPCLSRDFSPEALPNELMVNIVLDTSPDDPLDFLFGLEVSLHNRVHCQIGGTMCSFHSANAPEFHLHHGYVDKIWYDWQVKSSQHKEAIYSFDTTPMQSRIDPTILLAGGASPADLHDSNYLPGGVKVRYVEPTHHNAYLVRQTGARLTPNQLRSVPQARPAPMSEETFELFGITGDRMKEAMAKDMAMMGIANSGDKNPVFKTREDTEMGFSVGDVMKMAA